MPTIGLITEGPTDLQVLRLLLAGLCGSAYTITELLPVAGADGTYPPTGWTKVLSFIGDPEFDDALNNRDFPIDYVVSHLDSDSCELFMPPIPHSDDTNDVLTQIQQRLVQLMEAVAPHFYATYAHRILFAVAVRSTECWLLPLFYNDNTRTKTVNCLNSLNAALGRHGITIDKSNKQFGYKALLRRDELKPRKLKRDTILQISAFNPGFADFVAQVETQITPKEP